MASKRSISLLLILIAVSGLLLAAFAAQGKRQLATAMEALEAQTGSLELSSLAPAAVAKEHENRALLFLKALEASPAAPSSPVMKELVQQVAQNVRTPLNAQERENLHELLGQFANSLSLARRSVTASGSNFGLDYSQGSAMPLPDYMGLLELSGLLLAEARLAYQEGNFVLGESNLAALHSLRQALATEPILISQIIAMAVDRHFLECVQLALDSSKEHPNGLRISRQALRSRDVVDSLNKGLAGEALFVASWAIDHSKAKRSIQQRLNLARFSARMLQDYLYWLEGSSWSGVELLEEVERRRANTKAIAEHGPLYVTYPENLLEALEVEAASQLALQAVELAEHARQTRSAASTTEAEPPIEQSQATDLGQTVSFKEPFSDSSPTLKESPQGLTLFAPEAEQLWLAMHADHPPRQPARFRWHVPVESR